jgi:hypothetical protein
MTADLDTLSFGDYPPGDEVLPDPLRPCGGAAAVAGRAVDRFERSRALFEQQLAWADGVEAAGLEHGELEARLGCDARELFCQIYQDHLDLRAVRERPVEHAVIGRDGVRRGCVERGRGRVLQTVFGEGCRSAGSRIARRRTAVCARLTAR